MSRRPEKWYGNLHWEPYHLKKWYGFGRVCRIGSGAIGISAAYAVMRCLCVRVSVTFVSYVKTNKDIFEILSPSGSQAILVLPCQTGWRYSDGNPHNGGVECKWTTTTGTSDLLGGADTINQLSVITLRITLRRKVTTNEATYFEVWNIEG